MIHVRQNIVNRHPKPPTINNSENVEKEFDQQMRSLKTKQKHYAWKEAEVRQAVSPQRQETLRRQADLKEAMEEQLKLRESERQRLTEEQRKFDRYNEYLRKFSGPHSVEEEMTREQNRKEYLRGLMDDNIRLSTLKKEIQEKEKQLEAEMDRIRATMPCTWNRRHYL